MYGMLHSSGYGGWGAVARFALECAGGNCPRDACHGDCTAGYVAATKTMQVAIVKAKQYATAAV